MEELNGAIHALVNHRFLEAMVCSLLGHQNRVCAG